MTPEEAREIECLINYHGLYKFLRITSVIIKGKSFCLMIGDEGQKVSADALLKISSKLVDLSEKVKSIKISTLQKVQNLSGNLDFEKTFVKESEWNNLNLIEFCVANNIKESDLLNFCNSIMIRTGKDFRLVTTEIKRLFNVG